MNENRLVDSRESNVYDRIIKSKPNAAETCDFNRKKSFIRNIDTYHNWIESDRTTFNVW